MMKVLKVIWIGLAILVGIIFLRVLVFGVTALHPDYNYERKEGADYYEGCPYSYFYSYCYWTKTGYSGFKIGMSRSDFFDIYCQGNEFGTYAPNPSEGGYYLSSDSLIAQDIGRKNPFFLGEVNSFKKSPCENIDSYAPYDIFMFPRQAEKRSLHRHNEAFTLTFSDNKLVEVKLVRGRFEGFIL